MPGVPVLRDRPRLRSRGPWRDHRCRAVEPSGRGVGRRGGAPRRRARRSRRHRPRSRCSRSCSPRSISARWCCGPRCWPACTPAAPPSSRSPVSRSERWARSIPACSPRSTSTSGSRGSSSTSSRLLDIPSRGAPVPTDQSVPVDRPRLRVRGRRRTRPRPRCARPSAPRVVTWCERVDLFDVFRSDALGEGRRSLAYRVRFQAADRTLTDAEIGSRPRRHHRRGRSPIHGATLRV